MVARRISTSVSPSRNVVGNGLSITWIRWSGPEKTARRTEFTMGENLKSPDGPPARLGELPVMELLGYFVTSP
jgi:hypothetical protein